MQRSLTEPRGWACGEPCCTGSLQRRASSLGIDFLWQTPVTGISEDGVHLGGRKVSARWIIGADGGNSRVRRWTGLDAFRKRDCRYAFRQHYRVAPWTDRMELHWGRHGEIYVTPVSKDRFVSP